MNMIFLIKYKYKYDAGLSKLLLSEYFIKLVFILIEN